MPPAEGAHRFCGDRVDVLVHAAGVFFGKVPHQPRNVARPFAQRRKLDRENVESVIQIAAKLAPGDHLRQILVRCRNQPELRFDSAVRA